MNATQFLRCGLRGFTALLLAALAAVPLRAQQAPEAATAPRADGAAARQARIKDITSIEGVRDNALIGYGLVVGLNGTGDRRQTLFPTQTLANILQRMGVQIAPQAVRVNNVAAVFVTATLPPFARPGTKLDVTVSSIGDAKSLEGGLLLLTPLHAADGRAYASAQGPLTVGGYTAGNRANSRQVNHPTVGRIPDGGTVERDAALDLSALPRLSLLLREPDFAASRDIAAAINAQQGERIALAVDSRRVDLALPGNRPDKAALLLASIQDLAVTLHPRARVVVNERTGTVVMGREVKLGAVSVMHGTLSVEISTVFEVSQPPPLSRQGETVVVPQSTVTAQEAPARSISLQEGATVEDLVRGLHTIGATSRDIIAILQALKAAGALHAELEVL